MNTQDSSMLYKLIVLFMLKTADYPLTIADISDYVVVKGYTDALTLQVAVNELINDGLLVADKMHNRTYLKLSEEGRNTINSLDSRLAGGIKKDVYTYLATNDKRLKEDHSVMTKVLKKSDDEYVASLQVLERGTKQFEMQMSFPSESLAKTVCDNFEKESIDIYKYAVERLLR